jgi:hypothetical protein
MTIGEIAERLDQIGRQARHLNAAYHADCGQEEKEAIEARLIELRREESKLRTKLEVDYGEVLHF